MRFRNLGLTEAQVWDRYLIQEKDMNYLVENDGKQNLREPIAPNPMLSSWGVDQDTCCDALNPGIKPHWSFNTKN